MNRLVSVLLLFLLGFSLWKIGQYAAASSQQEAFSQSLAGAPSLADLQAENPDLAGWIQIPGTAIDYPVMHTPDRPDYYLYRDFSGASSDFGCIYAEEACDPAAPSDNVTLYGHTMLDGSMFAGLHSYTDAAFWEAHPDICFDTPEEQRTYRIFAVFRTGGSPGEGFAYHSFTDAASATAFSEFVAQCKALSFYDTGITPAYGDKLICLSTCEYTLTNGRLVVAAVLEEDETQALPMTPSGALCIISTDTLWPRRVSGCSLRFPDSC